MTPHRIHHGIKVLKNEGIVRMETVPLPPLLPIWPWVVEVCVLTVLLLAFLVVSLAPVIGAWIALVGFPIGYWVGGDLIRVADQRRECQDAE